MSDQKEGGTAIRDLQAALDSLGYPVDRDTRTGDYSGVFNGRTHNGVVGFQLRNGLRLTGMADDETQKKLYSGTGLPYSTPVSELPDDAGKTGGPRFRTAAGLVQPGQAWGFSGRPCSFTTREAASATT